MRRGESKEDIGEGKTSDLLSASEPNSSVPFTLLEGSGHNMYVAVFTVPVGLEEQIASRYINARGAQFALELGEAPGTVKTTFFSSDPKVTAEAIGVRLSQRILDPSPPGAEECSIM